MKSINFANPYLLIAIPVAILLLLLPYLFAIRKENKSKSALLSLILHTVIVVLVVFSWAGMTLTTVMTSSEVYIVADVSHSAKGSADLIDGYISEIEDNLPRRCSLGIVTFGKDVTVLTECGDKVRSVKEASNDPSASNIAEALEYTASLFSDNSLKRIVLITDGGESGVGSGELLGAVDTVASLGIELDAIYIDSNIKAGVTEAQICDVSYPSATYLGHKATADVLVQSNTDCDRGAILTLYKNGEEYYTEAVSLAEGYNVFNISLDTKSEGIKEYSLTLTLDGDTAEENNTFGFTEEVSGRAKILAVASTLADAAKAKELYGSYAEVDLFCLADPECDMEKLPFAVEDLAAYDEYLLLGVDVRELPNFTAFIESVEKCVSLFGKSLTVTGDTKIQNKTDNVLEALEDMLPVRYGDSDDDPKFYCFVLDTSRSMYDANQFFMMQEAAIRMLDLLNDNDYVAVVTFSGDATIAKAPTFAKNREEIAETIASVAPTQGTFIGSALELAKELLMTDSLSVSEKQVVLISDGLSYALEPDDPVAIARDLEANGIIVNSINCAESAGTSLLESIAEAGGGEYYYLNSLESVEDIVLTEIADHITDTVVEGSAIVNIKNSSDPALKGINSLPGISGYIYAKAKASATTVLTVKYEKSGGGTVDAPLYAVWDYGNGRVSALMTDLGGSWTSGWTDGSGREFLTNIVMSALPEEKKSAPYTLEVTYDGTNFLVELLPAALNPYAEAYAEVTYPDGTVKTEKLIFNSQKYYYEFGSEGLGQYALKVNYKHTYGENTALSYFNLSYSPEYNSFAQFDSAVLKSALRAKGTLHYNAEIDLSPDVMRVESYEVTFALPFLIAAAVLFVLDVIVRKLRPEDIKTLVNRLKRGGKKI